MKSGFKVLLVLLFAFVGLNLWIVSVLAVDKDELMQEIEGIDDPEMREAVLNEARDAYKGGEYSFDTLDTDTASSEVDTNVERSEPTGDYDVGDYAEFGDYVPDFGGPDYGGGYDTLDLSSDEGRTAALERFSSEKQFLLGEGATEADLAEIEKAISEGRDPGEIFEGFDRGGPGDYEGYGDIEAYRDFEFGGPGGEYDFDYEPTESEKEMMRESFERGEFGDSSVEFDRPEFDFDRPEMEGFDFEREMPEFEGFEREMSEFERPETDFEREVMEREVAEHEVEEREVMEREVMEREVEEREAREQEREEYETPGEIREY